jgi:drug/metabolite transporter (DMT)-like permease
VLFIVRPGGELFTPAILLPFSAAFCFALYQLITRKLASTDHALTSNFLSGLFGSVMLLLLLPGHFTTEIADIDLLFMLILGVLAMTAHILITIALQYATAATLAPFTYGQIVFAGLVGYIAFAHVPDVWAILGVLIISLSGLTVAYLQHQQQLKDAL